MYFGGARVKDAGDNWRWLFYDLKKRAWLGIRLTGEEPVKGNATTFNSLGTAYDAPSKTILAVNNRTNVWACRLDLGRADVEVMAEMVPKEQERE